MPTMRANFTAGARQQAPLRPMCFAERHLPLHAKPTHTKCNLTDTHHSHLTGTAGQRTPLAQQCKLRICSDGADPKTHPACPPTIYVHMHVHTQMHMQIEIHKRVCICAHTCRAYQCVYICITAYIRVCIRKNINIICPRTKRSARS